MAHKKYLSTSEYAKMHQISKMQVIRLIKNGDLYAERIGRNWLIPLKDQVANQIGLEKTTSLQLWNKIIKEEFNTNIAIENTKDREIIYSKLHSLSLPHEKCFAFSAGQFPTKKELTKTVSRLGKPFWISAVPNLESTHLNRLSKLGIYSVNSGWNFINELPEKHHYKIIVSQYPEATTYKGTALISKNGFGVAEFITGDRHYIMTRGFTLTDPMIFNQQSIKHYSSTISKNHQEKFYQLIHDVTGHFEFQHGIIENKKQITFFDYNEDSAYTSIDKIWQGLVNYYQHSHSSSSKTLFGLPASPGKASGPCRIIHHQSAHLFNQVKQGDIIISDTTTPEMTPIMTKAAAIITDLGGVTSHAAIVCRELGIPAIVGTKNATELLKNNQKVTVNATLGKITLTD